MERDATKVQVANDTLRSRLLADAKALLQGPDDELSIRNLTLRSGVSSKTAYKIFGSKSGILRELLFRELDQFRSETAMIVAANPVEHMCDVIAAAAEFSFRSPEFMKAICVSLFGNDKSLQTALDGPGDRFWLEVITPFFEQELIEQIVDNQLLAEHLLGVYISATRSHLIMNADQQAFEAKIGYGFCLSLAGLTNDQTRKQLLRKATGYERTLNSNINSLKRTRTA